MSTNQTIIPSEVVVLGAGPAGLTAAYELGKHNVPSLVFEQSSQVGGLARTESYKGYRFDIGGHRFFTKVDEVNTIWHDVLGDEFLTRGRLSRIFYDNKYFDYPLQIKNVVLGLGLINSFLILSSYIYARIRPYPQEVNLEEWVSNRFGRRLFRIFFKTYTEKVWGIPCNEIQAEWAVQRIANLTFFTALKNAIFKPKEPDVKSLIEEFEYPRLGPGMMWNAMQRKVQKQGSTVNLDSEIIRLKRSGVRINAVVVKTNDGQENVVPVEEILSSIPLKDLISRIDPPPPPEVLAASEKLKYRDFLTITLIVNEANVFPDNWIYIHSPKVKVGRIQNFKNWSPNMVADPSKTCLGLEYFVNVGDDMWSRTDENLVALAKKELQSIGLADAKDIEDGMVIRQSHAYPVYDSAYTRAKETLKSYVDSLENLQCIGRNGLHRYDNQDHAMLSAIFAVDNIFGATHNLWSINTEGEYHETATLPDTNPSSDKIN